jgi:hypothetical protein
MKKWFPLATLILVPITASCGDVKLDPVALSSKAKLEVAASKRVFFGHQSVGYNIIEGILAIERENGNAGPRIIEGRDARILDKPAVAHAVIGTNGDPAGKIRDFVSIVEGGVGERANIALMKFCYVDIGASTDVEALFAEYSGALSRLRSEYPHVVFPMTTVPLTTIERGLKSLVKKLLGREIHGREDNVARERFNELVRRECGDSRNLFDLARAESTGADGTEREAYYGGVSFRVLRDEYSSDGGHLNERGAAFVAARFISFIADASQAKSR